MKQVPLFPELLAKAEAAENAPPVSPRPRRKRPKPRWRKPPQLFPEHAEEMRRMSEAMVRTARIAADRSAAGSPGRRPMVRNLVSGLICVVRREVWGSRELLGRLAKVDPEWIRRLERESWSGRVIDELALEWRASETLRRYLGLSVVELIDLEEGRLPLDDALQKAIRRARPIRDAAQLENHASDGLAAG